MANKPLLIIMASGRHFFVALEILLLHNTNVFSN